MARSPARFADEERSGSSSDEEETYSDPDASSCPLWGRGEGSSRYEAAVVKEEASDGAEGEEEVEVTAAGAGAGDGGQEVRGDDLAATMEEDGGNDDGDGHGG